MLRARLATAAVAIPLLLALILAAPAWAFAAFVMAIALLGVAEYAALAFPADGAQRAATVAMGLAVIAGVATGDARLVGGGLCAATVAGLVWTLLARSDFEAGLHDLGIGLVGVLYVGLLLPHFVLVHQAGPDGPWLVIYLVGVAMIGDTSGYFLGRAFGRHKLMPRVSPGKTVEGAAGIVAGCLVAGALAKILFLSHWPWSKILWVTAVVSVIGQLGDLSESIMKRTFGAKESGHLFPGHGGVLDRIDSLLFPTVFVYYIVSL